MISSWLLFFNLFKSKEYYEKLELFWNEEYSTKIIHPDKELIFNAFNLCSLDDLKVVIVGQDPYHEPNQAMGLAFSVPSGVKLPPSLNNIYKEIENDLNIKMNYESGDLTYLAKQGVLLINAYLTVIEGQALSHHKKEYDLLMKDLFEYLNSLDKPIVYMLWGNFAKKYEKYITNPKHKILTATHPSPLGANKGGWFNMHLFSECNSFLKQNNIKPIDWKN